MGSATSKKPLTTINVITAARAFKSAGERQHQAREADKCKSKLQGTSNRENLRSFLREQKESKDETWAEYEQEKENKGKTTNEPDEKTTQLYAVSYEDNNDNMCPVCRKTTMLGVDGAPCRVCNRCYHKTCIEQTQGRFANFDSVLDLKSPIGWSCENCDDLRNLVQESEMETISSEFDEWDINHDSNVDLDEFLGCRKKRYFKEFGSRMPADEEEFEKVQFKLLDADRSGSISYQEFLKHEAAKCLMRREKEELVGMLSMKEKCRARLLYNVIDVDGDGVINEKEAKMAFRSWYSYIEKSKKKRVETPGPGELNEPILSPYGETDHGLQLSGMLMEGDENNDNALTWEEFLRNQALYILASRPNRVYLS